MGVNFNGITLSKVTFNGTELSKITFNGTVVYESGGGVPVFPTTPGYYSSAGALELSWEALTTASNDYLRFNTTNNKLTAGSALVGGVSENGTLVIGPQFNGSEIAIINLGNYACTRIQRVDLSQLTYTSPNILAGCFRSWTGLNTVRLPYKMTNFYTSTFSYCTNMTNIVIPTTNQELIPLESIAAFNYFTSNYKIWIPNSRLLDYQTATNWSSLTDHMVGY